MISNKFYPNDVNTIGSRIVTRRKELGLKAKDLAVRVGCHPPDISDWENGKTTPSLASLLKLAQALDISETWLLTGKEPAPPQTERSGNEPAVNWRDEMLQAKDTIIELQQEKIKNLEARVNALEKGLKEKASGDKS